MAASDGARAVEHPLVVEGALEERAYQRTLAEDALSAHTLVCLPTGLGKTAVSLLVTAVRLQANGGTAVVLAPTKPLVNQHAAFYRAALAIPDDEVVVFTGEVSPDDRADRWASATVVIATPQVIENDLVGSRVSLADVTHLTFDECHHATGDYAYNYIAERYHQDAERPLVTGMSASPGDDEAAILRVCQNLGLENVEVMTEADEDVARYTHDTDVEWEHVELPAAVGEIRELLGEVITDRMSELQGLGVTGASATDISEAEIQQIQGRLRALMDEDDGAGYEGMSYLAEIRKLRTGLSYVETQSVEAARRYFLRQKEAARSSGASKADQRMVSDPRVRRAIKKCRDFDELHPKFRRARMRLAESLGIEGGERVIVFTESRDTAETLTAFLDEHFQTRKFVGQADTDGSEGMTQTEQQTVLQAFRAGEFEVLVSTSVAEEGLDVPEVDLVLFYEPVPTAIRSIQRKGRTGRQTEGRVVVLIAEDTRDEAYFWKARQDERQMESELRALKDVAGDIEAALSEQSDLADVESEPPESAAGRSVSEGQGEGGPETADADEVDDGSEVDSSGTSDRLGQAGLDAFSVGDDAVPAGGGDPTTSGRDEPTDGDVATAGGVEGIEIVADQRELESTIARDLSTREEITTRLETLAVGDYVLSDRVVVERKTVGDFMDTLTGGDRSLFEQVGDAARHYERPVVVVEGTDLYGERNVHPKAIHGALASLAVDFGASVLRTTDAEETADLLEVIASREQTKADRAVSVHGEKQSRTIAEQQEYVVAAIGEVGPVIARSLLETCGSVERVMTADRGTLREADGVGEVTADRIREITASEYDPDE